MRRFVLSLIVVASSLLAFAPMDMPSASSTTVAAEELSNRREDMFRRKWRRSVFVPEFLPAVGTATAQEDKKDKEKDPKKVRFYANEIICPKTDDKRPPDLHAYGTADPTDLVYGVVLVVEPMNLEAYMGTTTREPENWKIEFSGITVGKDRILRVYSAIDGSDIGPQVVFEVMDGAEWCPDPTIDPPLKPKYKIARLSGQGVKISSVNNKNLMKGTPLTVSGKVFDKTDKRVYGVLIHPGEKKVAPIKLGKAIIKDNTFEFTMPTDKLKIPAKSSVTYILRIHSYTPGEFDHRLVTIHSP